MKVTFMSLANFLLGQEGCKTNQSELLLGVIWLDKNFELFSKD